MDAKTMRLMAQLKEDPSAVQQIFNSQDGKKLLQLLEGFLACIAPLKLIRPLEDLKEFRALVNNWLRAAA